MKLIYKITLFLLLAPSIALSQGVSNLNMLNSKYDTSWQTGDYSVRGSGSVMSSNLNSGMVGDYLFATTFTENSKEAFLNNGNERTNLVSINGLVLDYRFSDLSGLNAGVEQFVGYTSSKDFSELVLFGNKRFAGENVESNNLKFLNYSKVFVNYTKQHHTKSSKWKITSFSGLQVLTSLQEINAQNISLFTAENGEELNVRLDDLALSQRDDAVAGIGINLGLDLGYTINSSQSIKIQLRDFNFNYLFDRDYLYADSAFSFGGFTYRFGDDSLFNEQYLEEQFNQEVDSRTERKRFIQLPSTFNFIYSRNLENGNKIDVSAQSIDFNNFGSSLLVGYTKIYRNLGIRSVLGYGNFSGLQWREEIEYGFQKSSVKLDILNLHALFVPTNSTSQGIGISFVSQI